MNRRHASLLVALLLLSGCASTNVMEGESRAANERLPRPERIIIHDFAATLADVPADSISANRFDAHSTPQTPEALEVGRELGALVAENLAAAINAMGLTAVRAANQPPPRPGDIVIRGYFVAIDEGVAGKRVLVGFGSGAAELRTMVEGYQMTESGLRPLGYRGVEATGSKTPGILVPAGVFVLTGTPIGLIVGTLMNVSGEQGRDTIVGNAQRTADEIGNGLSRVFKDQGWI